MSGPAGGNGGAGGRENHAPTKAEGGGHRYNPAAGQPKCRGAGRRVYQEPILGALCRRKDCPITIGVDTMLTNAWHPNGTRIDPFADNYASGARAMVASEIRALFAVAARP